MDHVSLTKDLKAVQADVRARARVQKWIDSHFVEATIVEKMWAALILDGDPIVSVYDEDEGTEDRVYTLDELNAWVSNLDEVQMFTKSHGWIKLVCGETWDMVCDYSARLDDQCPKFHELQDWITRNSY